MFLAHLLINNVDTEAGSNAVFDRIDPVSGDVATRASAATLQDARSAANAAAAAFPAWSQTGPSERRRLLSLAADILDRRESEFVASMGAETGASVDWAKFNVHLGAEFLREAAAITTQITGSIVPSNQPGRMAMVMRQPAGVSLGIAPWNAPVILAVRAIAMPLACGNTVVLKASELAPKTHRLIGDVLVEAGFPPGVVNVVSHAPSDAAAVTEALIAHPAIRRINFTGSTRVGRAIGDTAAKHLKRCVLELGGKAPFLVLDDADIDEAVRAAAFGAFFNQGQICMSTERIVVMDAVADAFVAKFREKTAGLVSGPQSWGSPPLAAMISAESARRVTAIVEDAVRKGAQLLVDGRVQGAFMDATLLDHVTPAMRIYREESFGPVAAIVRVSSIDEAVTVANDNEYGLSSAVFGRDIRRAMQVAQRIESGICHINGATVSDEPQMSFGGMKASGYGRLGGLAAIDEFTETRWITISTQRGSYPI